MKKNIKTQHIFRVDLFGRDHPEGKALERDPWLYLRNEFDSRGNLLKELSYTPDGLEEQISSYTYNANGKIIAEDFEQAGDEFKERREYVRDENDRLSKEIHHYLDGTSDQVVFDYDENNRILNKVVYNDDEEVDREEHYLYENDKLVGEKVVSAQGDVLSTQTYTYHPNGLIMSQEQISFEDGIEVKGVHFFDESGNKIKSLVYNAQGQLVEIYKWFFDEKNSLLKSEEETQHKHNIVEYEFDTDKNTLKQTEMDAEGNEISCLTRSFDEDGYVIESHILSGATQVQPEQDYILRYEYEYYQ